MALLNGLIREAAVTGRTDTLNAWWGGRQGGRWAQQTVRAALPPATRPPAASTTAPPSTDPAGTLRELTELRDSGVVTDAEFEDLRARLRV